MFELISKKHILITGGLGFIGSFLAQALLQRGNRIVLLDQTSPEHSSAYEMNILSHPAVQVLQGSILDAQFLEKLPIDFDHIIHTAGILGIKKVSEKPILTANVNVLGTKNILDVAIKQKQLSRFIHFSTSEIYGTEANNSREEDHAVIPNTGTRWIYASSKHFSEYLLKAYISEYGVPGVIVRPFNVFGPHRKGGNAMTTLIRKALRNEEIQIDGTGMQTRCWCYIDDFIAGVLSLLSKEGIVGEAFNIGNDSEPISMLRLAQRICHLLHSSSPISILNNQSDDVLNRSPNIQKAALFLGYQPQVCLDKGILQTAQFEKLTEDVSKAKKQC